MGIEGQRFAEGQCIAISNDEAAIVLEAATLLDGKPVYKVLRAFDDDGDETTYVLTGTANVPGGPLCAECPLWYGGRCGLKLDLAA